VMTATVQTYFISDGSSIKIGRSTNPLKRLRSLQTAHHTPLSLVLTLDGDREQEFHTRFAKDKHRGEWFAIQCFLASRLWETLDEARRLLDVRERENRGAR